MTKNKGNKPLDEKEPAVKKPGFLTIPYYMKPSSWTSLGIKIFIALLILVGYLYKVELEHKYARDIEKLTQSLKDTEAIYTKTLATVQKSSSQLVDTLTTQLKEIEEHNDNLNRHNRMLLEQNHKLAETLFQRFSHSSALDTETSLDSVTVQM